jgi:hypothetical protein
LCLLIVYLYSLISFFSFLLKSFKRICKLTFYVFSRLIRRKSIYVFCIYRGTFIWGHESEVDNERVPDLLYGERNERILLLLMDSNSFVFIFKSYNKNTNQSNYINKKIKIMYTCFSSYFSTMSSTMDLLY